MEEHRVKVFEKVLRRIFGPKRQLHIDGLHGCTLL
jgi:hypothetical protein